MEESKNLEAVYEYRKSIIGQINENDTKRKMLKKLLKKVDRMIIEAKDLDSMLKSMANVNEEVKGVKEEV